MKITKFFKEIINSLIFIKIIILFPKVCAIFIVDFLNKKLSFLLEKKFFKIIISSLIFMNPIAIFPQVWTIFKVPNVTGISLTMWYIFAAIQAAVALEGIRVKSVAMFWSMFISLIQSMTIITVVLYRT
jgi:hypothetical protein